MERLLKESELKNILQVDVRTLRRWRSEGTGPLFCKLGSSIRYKPEDLQKWLDDHSGFRTTRQAELNTAS